MSSRPSWDRKETASDPAPRKKHNEVLDAMAAVDLGNNVSSWQADHDQQQRIQWHNPFYRKVEEFRQPSLLMAAGMAAAGLLVATGCFVALRYHIAAPHEYLIKTGLGVKDVAYAKTAVRWPLQKINVIDLRPLNYPLRLHNMSREKVEFSLPVNFTIGPYDPHENAAGFLNYAKRMMDMEPERLTRTILGVIEGETRGLTSVLSVEEMFNAKDRFKDDVVKNVQSHLEALGLKIYNANIQEMSDFDEKNKYFEYVKQRAIQSANYEAQVSVAEARKVGEVGMKERDRDLTIALATMNMEAELVKNERQAKVSWSESELMQQKALAHQASEMKRIETQMKTKQYEQEMLKELEKKRQEREMETLRASEMTKTHLKAEQDTRQAEADAVVVVTATKAEAEQKTRQAEADAFVVCKTAEAEAIQKEKQAMADALVMRKLAEAEADAVRLKADAHLEAERKRAEGIRAVLEAHATGLNRLTREHADVNLIKFYLGLEKHLFQDLAATQATAFQNLKPQFHVWSTGPQAEKADMSETITRVLQNMAPVLDGLKSSGVTIPFLNSLTPSARTRTDAVSSDPHSPSSSSSSGDREVVASAASSA